MGIYSHFGRGCHNCYTRIVRERNERKNKSVNANGMKSKYKNKHENS